MASRVVDREGCPAAHLASLSGKPHAIDGAIFTPNPEAGVGIRGNTRLAIRLRHVYNCIMQHLHTTSNVRATPQACAAQLLDVTPLVMRTIRSHMRGQRAADLSVPQFRALGHVQRHAGASLSDVAEHLGLTLPATSRLVDGLVQRGYVTRAVAPADRRAVQLHVSAKGSAMLDHTREHTQQHLAALLAPLTPDQRAQIMDALATLRSAFATIAVSAASDGTPAAQATAAPTAQEEPAT